MIHDITSETITKLRACAEKHSSFVRLGFPPSNPGVLHHARMAVRYQNETYILVCLQDNPKDYVFDRISITKRDEKAHNNFAQLSRTTTDEIVFLIHPKLIYFKDINQKAENIHVYILPKDD